MHFFGSYEVNMILANSTNANCRVVLPSALSWGGLTEMLIIGGYLNKKSTDKPYMKPSVHRQSVFRNTPGQQTFRRQQGSSLLHGYGGEVGCAVQCL